MKNRIYLLLIFTLLFVCLISEAQGIGARINEMSTKNDLIKNRTQAILKDSDALKDDSISRADEKNAILTLGLVNDSNDNSVNNDTAAFANAVIVPPFWVYWWIKAIIILLSVAFLWWLLKLKIRIFENQRQEFSKMVERLAAELVEANGKIQDLHHEYNIRNSLLEANNKDIAMQERVATSQNSMIVKKKKELEILHNSLEDLVKKRTEELLLAKDKAEESERLKAAFLANMSHEIRTPLNTIVGFSALLTLGVNDKNEILEYSNHISESSKSLLLLIDDILELSIIEAKQSKRNNSLFNVTHFLQSFFDSWHLKSNTIQRAILLNDKVLDDELSFYSDPIKIRQILENLVSNACKYTEFGSVEIGFEYKDSSYIFYVKDTGIGIPQKNIDAIHHLVENSQHNVSPDLQNSRTGLSLIISIRFATLLGGNFWLESKLGFGTTFYFSLPASIVQSQPTA